MFCSKSGTMVLFSRAKITTKIKQKGDVLWKQHITLPTKEKPACLGLFIQRTVGSAGAVILPFLVHAERIPCRRTEDIRLRNIVHTDGNTKHGAKRDKVCADVSVGDGTVVGTPVVHDAIDILEGVLRGVETWSEPCCWPCWVSSLVKFVMSLFWKYTCLTFSNLKCWSNTINWYKFRIKNNKKKRKANKRT